MVQRRAARFVFNAYQPIAPVTKMINNLGWEKLETRRLKARLTMMYKIKHNLVAIKTAFSSAQLNSGIAYLSPSIPRKAYFLLIYPLTCTLRFLLFSSFLVTTNIPTPLRNILYTECAELYINLGRRFGFMCNI